MRLSGLAVCAIAGICLIYGYGVGRFNWPPAGWMSAPAADDDISYAAARAEVLAGLPGRGPLVMLGDSITEMGHWDELLPGWPLVNRGIASDTTADVLARLDDVVALQPVRVVLLIGVNDVLRGVPAAETVANIKEILDRLTAAGARVTLQSVLQVGLRLRGAHEKIAALNAQLRDLAAASGADFLDLNAALAPDGVLPAQFTWDNLHLTSAGYRAWRDVLIASEGSILP
jgi:lysophospholipase L1-like esterase